LALNLPPAHRFARISYAPRTISFGYAFLVLGALVAERNSSGWVMVFGAVQFLAYPHLAYLHARLAADSKGAETRNLLIDALTLGAWVAQINFALWPVCGLLTAVSLNSVATGGPRGLVTRMALFAAGVLAGGFLHGFDIRADTGPVVTGLSLLGIVGYTTWIGLILRSQNRRLVDVREALRKSQEQFQFIAEHAGDLVAAVDISGRARYLSPGHAGYFGAERSALNADWTDFVLEQDRVAVRRALQRMAEERTGLRLLFRVRRSDGDSRDIDCQANPIVDRDMRARTFILVCRDVTVPVSAAEPAGSAAA